MKNQTLLLVTLLFGTATAAFAAERKTSRLERQPGQHHLTVAIPKPPAQAQHADDELDDWSRQSTLVPNHPHEQQQTTGAHILSSSSSSSSTTHAAQHDNNAQPQQQQQSAREGAGRQRLRELQKNIGSSQASATAPTPTQQLQQHDPQPPVIHQHVTQESQPTPSASALQSSSSSSSSTYLVPSTGPAVRTTSPVQVLFDTGTSLSELYDPRSRHHLTEEQKAMVKKLMIGGCCVAAVGAGGIAYCVGRYQSKN